MVRFVAGDLIFIDNGDGDVKLIAGEAAVFVESGVV